LKPQGPFFQLLTQSLGLIAMLFLVSCNPASTEIQEDFFPGVELSPKHSRLSISSSEVLVGESIQVTLQLRDQNGNPYISNLPTISFFTERGSSSGTFGTIINNGDGSYTASFTGDSPGSPANVNAYINNISISGELPSLEVIPIVQLDWAPLIHDFGSVEVDTPSAQQTFTLTNSDIGLATDCSPPTITNSSDFSLVTDNCGSSDLSGNSSCTVVIEANPGSLGLKTTTLSRTCMGGDIVSTSEESIKVTAVPPASLSWDPLSQYFNSTITGELSESRTFTLTNEGPGSAIDCSPPVLSNNTDFRISIDNCGVNDLAPSASCNVNIQGQPQTHGTKYTTLSRSCRIGGTVATTSDAIYISVSIPNASLAWRENSNHLGDLKLGKSSPVLALSLLNKGYLSASGCSAPVLSNTTDFTIVEDQCGSADVEKWGKCKVLVKANPSSAGEKTATLTRNCSVGGSPSTSLKTSGYTSSPIAISAAFQHTCALMSDGTVKCWGYNGSRQLGNGELLRTNVPVTVQELTNAVAISSKESHSCALLADTTVKCWGRNSYGQLGDGTKTTPTSPVAVNSLTGVTAVSMGVNFSCALLSDSTVKCWGYNSVGQLGNGSTTESLTPTSVMGLTGVTEISGGGSHSCALLSDKTIKCWGHNGYGQLGDGTQDTKNSPVAVADINNAIKIYTSSNYSCAILEDNSVQCWGYSHSTTPANIAGLSDVAALGLYSTHRCALYLDDSLKCYGTNNYGQLGDETNVNKTTPSSATTALTGVASMSLGEAHSCAILNDETIRCWGRNEYGQLGDGSFSYKTEPEYMGINNAIEVAAGNNFNCALLDDKTVTCWGQNKMGQMGDGTNIYRQTASPTISVSNVKMLKAGQQHACALLEEGTIKCWGYNGIGQLGDGTQTSRSTPVLVQGITNATAIDLGDDHTCALLADKTAWCWGSGLYGRLGNGSHAYSSVPIQVSSLSNVAGIAAGYMHSCAFFENGRAKCWGYNSQGSLGDGTTTTSFLPTDVLDLTNVVSMSIGGSTSCALLSDKSGRCWGSNGTGQTGTNASGTLVTPRSVVAVSEAKSISNSVNHGCSLLLDGFVKCWGSNVKGQLGNGSNTTSRVPQPVYGHKSISHISKASNNNGTCSVSTSGKVHCWGDGEKSHFMYNEWKIRSVVGF
jgi:alpha-tubulin suppressor-like RCC1 family protein